MIIAWIEPDTSFFTFSQVLYFEFMTCSLLDMPIH